MRAVPEHRDGLPGPPSSGHLLVTAAGRFGAIARTSAIAEGTLVKPLAETPARSLGAAGLGRRLARARMAGRVRSGPDSRSRCPLEATNRRDSPARLGELEATEATIDLAREASAPATRIGREVLEYERSATEEAPSDPDANQEVASTASEMLHTVGEQVNAGVRPISGSARHAFSFLLGPPSDHAPATPNAQESF